MEQISVIVSSFETAEKTARAGALPVLPVEGAHWRGMKGVSPAAQCPEFPYGAEISRLFRESELDEVSKMLAQPLIQNAAYVWFNDLCVLSDASGKLRRRLIYKPEFTVVSAADAGFWCSSGIAGVSISPLLTIHETEELLRRVPEAEVMIHGHCLMSASGRKLLSEYADRCSMANGAAHSFALKETTRSERFAVRETGTDTLIYTDYVLESFEELPRLLQAGGHRFLIDGSFLDEEELLDALKIYQALIRNADCRKEIAEFRAGRTGYAKGYYEQETIL